MRDHPRHAAAGTAWRRLLIGICLAGLALTAPAARPAPAQPAATLHQQFEQRLAQCPQDDAEACLAVADWACAQGLPEEADRLYRAILARRPRHHEAYTRLLDLAGHRPIPRASEGLDLARSLLPPRFVKYETKRFIVLSDASTTWTREQAERLERAHHQFLRFCHRLDLRPLPLRHKLVGVFFESRDDYQRFACEHDRVANPSISGYYSPQRDWIVFYNIQSNPSLAEARDKLEEMQMRVDELENRLRDAERHGRKAEADTARRNLARYQSHLHEQRQRVEDFAARAAIATSVHEAVHQLAFHTEVQTTRVQYPLWISEGLATAFETDAPGEAFGPDHEYAPRRETFQRLLVEDELIDLRQIIPVIDLTGAADHTIEALYHESYALFVWMSRFRRDRLRDYLTLMLEHPPGPIEGEEHLTLLGQAFGNVDQLQRAWLRHERAILPDDAKTPE